MKTLNTQLASWAQLRHDTILYAKQSYTAGGSCVYPTGFVEPRVEFWTHLEALASRAAEAIALLRYDGKYPLVTGAPDEQVTNLIALAQIQTRQVGHFRNFAATVSRLGLLARKEMAHECFSREDEQFIDGMMQGSIPWGACGEFAQYSGWYPQLFYRTIYWTSEPDFQTFYGAGAFDALVADVHTDVPCFDCGGDPGSVLHNAVGYVNLLVLAVDNGMDRFICAGPVLSHYEFEVIGEPRRISDDEWRGSPKNSEAILLGAFPEDVPSYSH